MNFTTQVIQTDVLIIGGGLAGARAAIEAQEHKARVMMVAKAGFGRGGASGFPQWGGICNVPNGDSDPIDRPEEEFNDIIRAAAGMCDEKLARILAYETIDRVNELQRWGLDTIIKVDGKYLQSQACFSTRRRGIRTTGLAIAPSMLLVLKQQIEKRNIEIIDDVMIVSLLMQNGNCVGALGVNRRGKFLVYTAKSTVMATGGAAGLFPTSHYPHEATGDGYALGFRAGAELFNMEFIQIMPGTWVTLLFLNPDVCNRLGDRFLPRYLPVGVTIEECFMQRTSHQPFSSADHGKYLDIAAYKEILEGRGTENRGIYLDFTRLSEEDIRKAVEITRSKPFGGVEFGLDKFRASGINILEKPLEAIPGAHAFNGGFRINEKSGTTLPGLFAAGETAAGPHGAARLGGNMVATCLVFGARAGRFAAERANGLGEVAVNQKQVDEECSRVTNIISRGGDTKPQEIKNKINDIMWRSCLTVRNQTGLGRCIQELRRLRNEELPRLSVEGDTGLFEALEIPNLLDVGQIVAHAAMQRRESRGSHYREDYPDIDDENWLRTTTISKENLELE